MTNYINLLKVEGVVKPDSKHNYKYIFKLYLV